VSIIPVERLALVEMASGQSSLLLTERVAWSEFRSYANTIVSMLGGTVASTADGAGERVWDIAVQGERFWIAFDDFPLGVSLEPQTVAAGSILPAIRETLRSVASTRER
jgi:hypothetical protein